MLLTLAYNLALFAVTPKGVVAIGFKYWAVNVIIIRYHNSGVTVMVFQVVIINKTTSKRPSPAFSGAKELKRIVLLNGSTQIIGNGYVHIGKLNYNLLFARNRRLLNNIRKLEGTGHFTKTKYLCIIDPKCLIERLII